MKDGLLISALVWLALSAAVSAADPIAIADLKRSTPVDFQKEILPLFKKSCTACHNQTDAKGDLVLESPKAILVGGESGAAVVPGKSGESLLLQVASHQAKPTMPPKNNKANAAPLKPEELGLIKLWIDQGAKGDVVVHETPIEWQPLPGGLNPIYAVAVSPDGQYVAAGRANQVFIYHVPTKSLVTRLTDPSLIKSGLFKQAGNAHRDLVQSLAFSPKGDLLASGGYRVVKLWRRPVDVQKHNLSVGEAVRDVAISGDGKWLATTAAANAIKLFDLTTGKPVRDLAGHGGPVHDFKFSADNTKLITASADKTVRLFSVSDGKELGKVETPAEALSVTWLAKGEKFASGHSDNIVRVWETAAFTAKPAEAAKAEEKPAEKDAKAAEPADAKPADAKAADAKPAEAPAPAVKPLHEIKIGGAVNALATVPTADTQIIAGGQDGNIHHIDANSGKSTRQFNHGAPVTDVAVRPDGQRFASAGGVAKLWKIDSSSGVIEIKGVPEIADVVEERQRLVTLGDQHIAYYKKLVTDTEARKKAETDALAKANEAVKKAEEDLKAKDEAFKKVMEAKAAAEKAMVDADAAVKKAAEGKTAADAAQVKAKDDAKAAATKADEMAAALKKATDAKTAAEKAEAEQEAKVKAAMEKVKAAQEALAKKADDAALMEAVKAAEKAAADEAAKVKATEDALAAATTAVDAATKAKTEADKAKESAAAMQKAADDAKTAADKAVADAANMKKTAEQQVKAQEKPFNDAMAALEASQRNKSSSMNAVANTDAAVKRVDGLLTQAQTDLKQSEDAKTKAAAEVEAAKKMAADAVKPITTVAFAPGGGLLVTGGEGQIVQTWNAEDGSPATTYRGHGAAVLAATVAPDGSIITGGADQKAIIWDVAPAWTLERSIGSGDTDSPLIDRVISLAFSPDGKTLATGGGQPSRSGELKLWNVENGALVREIKDAHSDTVFGIEFSFDGKHLASCAADKFVKTWTVADGKFVMSFEGHTHHVLGVSWMADGRTLASAGADGVVKVWDFIAGGQKRTIKGGDKEITAIHFIGVSDTALTSAGDNTVRTVRENGSGAKNYGGATDAMHCAAVTPDGKIIVAGGQDSVLRIWNDKGAEVAKFEPPADEKPTAKK